MSRNLKIVLLGDSSVGKTCLAVRFVMDKFSKNEEPTIGAAFLAKNMTFEGRAFKLSIWDTAGQERYKSLAPMYYRGAKAAVVVYDLTHLDSFIGAKRWVTELQNNQPGCFIILVGNKSDIDTPESYDIEQFVLSHNLIHIEVSAKTGHNVNEIFNKICQNIQFVSNEPTHPEIHRSGYQSGCCY